MRTTTNAHPAVDALIAAGLLDSDRRHDAVAVLSRAERSPSDRATTGVLTEIAGYVGGILVIAAAAVFLATQWSSMGPATRVAALAVGGLVLAAAGISATRLGLREPVTAPGHEIRRYLAGALLVAASGVLGGAAGLWANEFTGLREPRPQSIGFGVVVALAALSYRLVPSALGQIATAVALLPLSASLVFDQTSRPYDPWVFGGSLLAAGVVWGVLAEVGVFREETVARVVAGVLAVFGAQNFVFVQSHSWVGYAGLALVGVVGFALYVRGGHWPHLVAGVLALTLSATEAAVDWSDGAVGAAGALLIAGAALLGLSVLGMRMRRHPGAHAI